MVTVRSRRTSIISLASDTIRVEFTSPLPREADCVELGWHNEQAPREGDSTQRLIALLKN